jgi:hypothetical protein
VHYLLWAGFSRLDRSQLSKLHEPAISGLICQAIALVLDDRASPTGSMITKSTMIRPSMTGSVKGNIVFESTSSLLHGDLDRELVFALKRNL